MAIRTVSAPIPAAGVDWSYVVPGQWWPKLIGVTARLITGTPVTTIPDETGNGHTASLIGGNLSIEGAQGPYAAGVNNYSVFDQSTAGSSNAYAQPLGSAAFNVAAGTIESLIYIPTHAAGNQEGNGWGATDSGGVIVRIGIGTDSTSVTDPAAINVVTNGTFRTLVAPGTVSRNAWHSLALTWDGVTLAAYIDGNAAGTHAGDMPVWGTGRPFLAGQAVNNSHHGYHASDAFYGAALSGAQLAAHFAARGSWTAYRAAVLADSPIAFWGLNTVVSGPSRNVVLRVTNGTATVAQYPASFPATTAQAFTWSWQALGPGALSSTDGAVNSVAIPAVNVAPGYVISARTLDLAATDQWGPITLWFDDGTTGGGAQGFAPAPYLDAYLVPDFQGRR